MTERDNEKFNPVFVYINHHKMHTYGTSETSSFSETIPTFQVRLHSSSRRESSQKPQKLPLELA